jgi:hypothetical protein
MHSDGKPSGVGPTQARASDSATQRASRFMVTHSIFQATCAISNVRHRCLAQGTAALCDASMRLSDWAGNLATLTVKRALAGEGRISFRGGLV